MNNLPIAVARYSVASAEDDDIEHQQQKRASAPPDAQLSWRDTIIAAVKLSLESRRPATTPHRVAPPVITRVQLLEPPMPVRRLPCFRKRHLRCMYYVSMCLLGVGILVAGIVCFVDASRRGVHIEHRTKHTHHPGIFPRDDDEVITTCHGDGCTEHNWAVFVLLPLGCLSTLVVMCFLCALAEAVYGRLEE